ncbi:MAG TPA: adenosine kinase [Pseudomonadales bacterium]|nr:adenosine kinase [Pseudomonadales bacterium]
MSNYDVYGLGNALVDTEFEVDDAFLSSQGIAKGHMTLVEAERQAEIVRDLEGRQPHRASGGSAANTLMAVSGFGGRAYYSCKIADDEVGRFFVRDLLAAGVDTNADQHHGDGVSGQCIVLVTPDAERSMNTFLGISASLSRANVQPEALQSAKYLYMEGYLCSSDTARDAMIHARALAREAGVKIAATLSDPAMVEIFAPQLREMLGDQIDHLFCNEEEVLKWTETTELDAAADVLKGFATTFSITCGSRGCLIWDGEALRQIDSPKVKAVDTVGAGDLFAGAYLYALCRGQDHVAAATLANRAAGRLVTHYGARLPAAALQELLAG